MPGRGCQAQIPAEVKAEYLRRLIAAGFTHIDAVSFVSPAAVPQMADSEQVLDELEPSAGVEIIGIVVNEKGAQTGNRDSRGADAGLSVLDLCPVSAAQPEADTGGVAGYAGHDWDAGAGG